MGYSIEPELIFAKWLETHRDQNKRTASPTSHLYLFEIFCSGLHPRRSLLAGSRDLHGKRDQLEGKIQERYGLAKDQVKKDVDDWYGTQSW